MIRRLLQGDENLLREALSWDDTMPRWVREMDAAFNTHPEKLIEKLPDRSYWFIGIFDPLLTAIVIVEHRGCGQFEGHLMSQRQTNAEIIETVIAQLLLDLCETGLREAFVWIAEKNLGVRKLCVNIGIAPDGLVMFKGSYRGRVIKWLRHSITREQVLMTQAA